MTSVALANHVSSPIHLRIWLVKLFLQRQSCIRDDNRTHLFDTIRVYLHFLSTTQMVLLLISYLQY